VTIRPIDDGPYLVEGGAVLFDGDGNRYEAGDVVALCRCGHSSTKPFCDGSHETAGFTAVTRLAAPALVG